MTAINNRQENKSLSFDEAKKRNQTFEGISADGSETRDFEQAVAIEDKETRTTFVKSNLPHDVLKRLADRSNDKGFRMVIMSEKNWSHCMTILKAVVILINKEKQKEAEKQGPAEAAKTVEHVVVDKRTVKEINQGARKGSFLLSKDFKEVDKGKEILNEILKEANKKAIIEKTNDEMQETKKEELDKKLKKKILSQEVEKFEIEEKDRRHDKDMTS